MNQTGQMNSQKKGRLGKRTMILRRKPNDSLHDDSSDSDNSSEVDLETLMRANI